jgi:hypothetical protein
MENTRLSRVTHISLPLPDFSELSYIQFVHLWYIALNFRTAMNNELERIWKETVVA